jgi:DNA-damage-inducible protein D
MERRLEQTIQALEAQKLRSRLGGEYWMARDVQHALGYANWQNFESIIIKAILSCKSAGDVDPHDQFIETSKKMAAGKGALVPRKDYFLTRYACYLITMNGDVTKPEIATAQTYFAVQTRRQEIQEQLTAEEGRIELRDRVQEANRNLNSAAKQAGVQRYALFHDAGYRGLYEMGLGNIKRKKGIAPKDDLLDRAGRA